MNVQGSNMCEAQVFTEEEMTQINYRTYVPREYNFEGFQHGIDNTVQRSLETMKKLDVLKKEFEHEREEAAKWRKGVDEKLDTIMRHLACSIFEEHSQSLLKDGIPIFLHPKVPPFVVIKYPDGETEDIHFSDVNAKDLMAATTTRELVRKTLVHVHNGDITALRGYTLTGKTYSAKGQVRAAASGQPSATEGSGSLIEDSQQCPKQGEENEHSVQVVKLPLPLRTVLIVQEVTKKLFPVNSKLQEVDPKLAGEQVSKKEQEVRAAITAVLNYFSTNYDEKGKIIQSSPGSCSSKANKNKKIRI